MRSPHRRGAGRSGALSLVIALAAISLAGSAVFASHHLADEKADDGRTIEIALRTDTILVDGRIRADIYICGAGVTDLAKCDFARKATVTALPKGVIKPNKGRGSQVMFTGKKPGTVTITAKQKGLTGSAELKVNGPPDRTQAKPDDERLLVRPEEAELEIGQEFVVSAYGCRLSEGLAGDDGIPNRLDDSCMGPETTWNVDPSSGVVAMGTAGPGTGLFRVDSFGGAETDELAFAGVQVVTNFGATLVSGLVRNARYVGPLLGDANGDGVRDGADIDHLAPDGLDIQSGPIDAAQIESRGLGALDLNEDGVIDDIDAGLFALLEFFDGTGLSRRFVPEPSTGDRAAADTAMAKAVEQAAAGVSQSTMAAEQLADPEFRQFLRDIRWSHVDEDSSRMLATALAGGGEPASGDVFGSGAIEAEDWAFAQDLTRRGLYHAAADMDGDGDLDEDDLSAMQVKFHEERGISNAD